MCETNLPSERNITSWISLQSKEELLYYRIFQGCFGESVTPTVGRSRSL